MWLLNRAITGITGYFIDTFLLLTLPLLLLLLLVVVVVVVLRLIIISHPILFFKTNILMTCKFYSWRSLYRVWVEEPEEKNHLEDLNVDGKII
jgi:hypothetical protein